MPSRFGNLKFHILAGALFIAMAGSAHLSDATARTGKDLFAGNGPLPTYLPIYRNWSAMIIKHQALSSGDLGKCANQRTGRCETPALDEIVSLSLDQPKSEQMAAINKFINKVDYVSDIDNWNAKDYWAAPVEFFRKGGDCEDFAIAKYMALRRLGFAPSQLRVVILQDMARNRPHAVLVVRLDSRTFVLDNAANSIREWSEISAYRALYSLNENAVWMHLM